MLLSQLEFKVTHYRTASYSKDKYKVYLYQDCVTGLCNIEVMPPEHDANHGFKENITEPELEVLMTTHEPKDLYNHLIENKHEKSR